MIYKDESPKFSHMKRLALLIVIITLPIILFFQYKKYRRFHPPSAYDYPISDSIDVHYHDPEVLLHYYENAYKIGSFAREIWSNKGIDIRYPEAGDPETQSAVLYYRQLQQTTAHLEGKLIYSQRLKNRGFDNQEIKIIEEKGISPENFELLHKKNLMGLKIGNKGNTVWELQKLLTDHGYNIPIDGVFSIETDQALKSFQRKSNIFPSGITDETTIRALITKN